MDMPPLPPLPQLQKPIDFDDWTIERHARYFWGVPERNACQVIEWFQPNRLVEVMLFALADQVDLSNPTNSAVHSLFTQVSADQVKQMMLQTLHSVEERKNQDLSAKEQRAEMLKDIVGAIPPGFYDNVKIDDKEGAIYQELSVKLTEGHPESINILQQCQDGQRRGRQADGESRGLP